MSKAQPSTAKLGDLVDAAREALEPLRGLKLTSSVAYAGANLLKQVLPWASRELLLECMFPKVLQGRIVDTGLIDDRARNTIAALTGGIS